MKDVFCTVLCPDKTYLFSYRVFKLSGTTVSGTPTDNPNPLVSIIIKNLTSNLNMVTFKIITFAQKLIKTTKKIKYI
jgi:hypothetical protein